jgi:ADP-ribose pyrophosphatase YjhB (NUDIX family)
MKFCSQCGAPLTRHIPAGDTHERHVCTACAAIHYQNPKMVIGCIPEWEDRILLCRRAIEPRYGLWTLPAGFMELQETTAEAAAREAREEANAVIEIGELFTLYSLPHIDQVYMFYRGQLRVFREEEVPWSELAFTAVIRTLEHYFADRRTGAFQVHHGEIRKPLR